MQRIKFRLSTMLLLVALISVSLSWMLDHARLSKVILAESAMRLAQQADSFDCTIQNAEAIISDFDVTLSTDRQRQVSKQKRLLLVVHDLYRNRSNADLGPAISPEGVRSRASCNEALAGRVLELLDVEKPTDLSVIVEYYCAPPSGVSLALVEAGHMTAGGEMSDEFEDFVNRAIVAHYRELAEMERFTAQKSTPAASTNPPLRQGEGLGEGVEAGTSIAN